jgi:hypothetical protein
MRSALFVALVVLAACKADPSAVHPDGSTSVDARPTSDARSNEGWTPLISRPWTLQPGATNVYKCTRLQVPTDMWIAGFRAVSPAGTHHEVLTISTTNTTTGDYDCSAGTLDTQMLYAAGVGTDDFVFPDGVAMHVAAGTYINLNLHLYNATDLAMSDTSGVMVRVVEPAAVAHEADMMFSGTSLLFINNDGAPHDFSGGCTAPADWHLFGLWPHMHQTATHQTWQYTPRSTGTAVKLIDDAFRFEEQKNYPIPETIVHKGDAILTTCTYVNSGKNPIIFGDGSDKEMCFTGMYKYPAGGGLFDCTSGPHL